MRYPDERRQEMTSIVARLLVSRKRGEKSEDGIAEELGFKSEYGVSPAQRMYGSLKDWALPDWVVYPQSLLDDMNADPTSPKKKPPRKPRIIGEALELPPASGAEDLLRETIFQQLPQDIQTGCGDR